MVAYSGGTLTGAFGTDAARWDEYIASQKRIAKAAADAGATVILSNHSEYDGAYTKARLIGAARGRREPSVHRRRRRRAALLHGHGRVRDGVEAASRGEVVSGGSRRTFVRLDATVRPALRAGRKSIAARWIADPVVTVAPVEESCRSRDAGSVTAMHKLVTWRAVAGVLSLTTIAAAPAQDRDAKPSAAARPRRRRRSCPCVSTWMAISGSRRPTRPTRRSRKSRTCRRAASSVSR